MRIKHLISCDSRMIMDQAAEFPPSTPAADSVTTCGDSEANAPKYDCAGIHSLSVSGMFVDEPHSHNGTKRPGKLSAHRQSAREGMAGRTGKAARPQEEGGTSGGHRPIGCCSARAAVRAAGHWANRANGTAKTGRDRLQRHCTRRELYR